MINSTLLYSAGVIIQTCRINMIALTSEQHQRNADLLTSKNISEIFRLALNNKWPAGSFRINRLVLNLGVIPAVHFSVYFNQRLAQALVLCLEKLIAQADTQNTLPVHIRPAGFLASAENNPAMLRQLAIRCLQNETLLELLQNRQPQYLRILLKQLLQGVDKHSSALADSTYSRVTASRLGIAALGYLLHQAQGRDWLSQHTPSVSQVTDWAEAVARGEIPPEQIAQLLTNNRPSGTLLPGQPVCSLLLVKHWLLPLWQQSAMRQVIRRLKGERGVRQVDAYLHHALQRQEVDVMRDEIQTQDKPDPLSQSIGNAGLLLLWPLFPQLFSQLNLWEEGQFISDAVRWQAVYCLDRLVWGEADPEDERLTLNRLLCNISPFTSIPAHSPLSVLQQQQTDDWLTAVGQRLAGWQKLSLTDIRQLFLQRVGEISTEGTLLRISVKPKPYDFLLRDWPWPMTLASFPWAEQPLTIVWPLTGLTG